MVSIRWSARAASLSVAATMGLCTGMVVAADEPAKAPAPQAAPAPADAKTVPGSKLRLPVGQPQQPQEPEITLKVGSKAPPLTIASWAKGEPVEGGYKKDQVYVVEFWATWCGPCLAGMPHISELQAKHGKAVKFVGVTDEDAETVTEFLKTDRMEGQTWDQVIKYALAIDKDSATNEAFMLAAGRNGIPCAFVVGKTGEIEWIGHPMAMDEDLQKIVDGKWDRAAYLKKMEEEAKAEAEARADQLALQTALQSQNWDEALTILDRLIVKNPEAVQLPLVRLSILGAAGREDEAKKSLDELIKKDWEKGDLLGMISMGIASKRLPGTMAQAEKIGLRSVELTEGKDIQSLHSLARIYAEQGKFDDAIATQKKAVALQNEHPVLLNTLKQYEEMKKAAEAPPAK